MKRFLHYLTENKFENYAKIHAQKLYDRIRNDSTFAYPDHEAKDNSSFVNERGDFLPFESSKDIFGDGRERTGYPQSDIDILKKHEEKFPNGHLDRATESMHSQIKHIDPSPNQEHGQWLMNQYLKGAEPNSGGIKRWEDLEEFKEPLEFFHRNKKRKGFFEKLGHSSDIFQYKTADDFLSMHEKLKDKEPNPFPDMGYTTIHDDENLAVHRIDSKAGACYWGHGTRWCTRHEPKVGKYFKSEEDLANDPYINYTADYGHLPEDSEALDRAFDKHYNTHGGPMENIFVIHNKKSGEKFQYHQSTGQFMDKNDMPEPVYKQVPFEVFNKILDKNNYNNQKIQDDEDVHTEYNKSIAKFDYLDDQAISLSNYNSKKRYDQSEADEYIKQRKELLNKHLTDEDAHNILFDHEGFTTSYSSSIKQHYIPKTENYPELNDAIKNYQKKLQR